MKIFGEDFTKNKILLSEFIIDSIGANALRNEIHETASKIYDSLIKIAFKLSFYGQRSKTVSNVKIKNACFMKTPS